MVYLLHLEPAFKRARHFVGATSDPSTALALARGDVPIIDAPLLVAARDAGVQFTVERTWVGGERERARIRSQKGAATFCPLCQRLNQARRRK